MEEKHINGRKHVKLFCPHTKEWFWKDKSEYTRCLKSNPNHIFYKNNKASIASRGKGGYKHLKKYQGKYNENLNVGSCCDEYSPFRYFIRQAKKRVQYGDFDITLEFLKNLWDKQNGICPYTGYKMELPPNIGINRNSIYCASLDRIDSNKGYLKNNVEFVCQGVNLAKKDFSSEETLDFFQNINNI